MLLIGYRAVKKKQIMGSSGAMRGTRDPGFYLRVGGFWLAGVVLMLLAAMQLQRTQGWGSLSVYLLLTGMVIFLLLRVRAVRKGLGKGVVSMLRPRKSPGIQPAKEIDAGPGPRSWVLAAAALPGLLRGVDPNTLAGRALSGLNERRTRKWLQKNWEVDGPEELEEIQEWLLETGHRTEFFEEIQRFRLFTDEYTTGFLHRVEQGLEGTDSPQEMEELKGRVAIARERGLALSEAGFLAWDYLRYLDLCRAGFLAGYLDEEEAWDAMLAVAQVLQSRYDSWEACAAAYLAAREYWSVVDMAANGVACQKIYDQLLNSPNSPWKLVPWGLALY